MLRVQPVCVKLWKKVFGPWNSSTSRSPPRPVAPATTIWVIQSGCAGQPGTLMTGNPDFERQFAPKAPPCLRFRNCKPCESLGFGAVAGMPPQVAQSPIATTYCAASARSFIHCFIGRPAKRFHSPVPLGAFTTVPSNTKISSGIFPEIQSRRILCRLSPSSTPRDGCQSTLIPKSVTRSQALGSSALRKDIVLPEQAPPCSHRRFATNGPPGSYIAVGLHKQQSCQVGALAQGWLN